MKQFQLWLLALIILMIMTPTLTKIVHTQFIIIHQLSLSVFRYFIFCYFVDMTLCSPVRKYIGAQTSTNIVASSLRTQWYTKFVACVQFWILAKALQLFLFADESHSVALEGHRDTMDIVGTDSEHFIDKDVYKTKNNKKKKNKPKSNIPHQ